MLPRLFAWLREKEKGAEVDALIAELALPTPENHPIGQMSVPLAVHRAVFERAAAHLGDPFLGLHLALEMKRGDYGVVEFTARSAPDAGQALERFVRTMRAFTDGISLRLERGPEGVIIKHGIAGEPLALGRQCNEYSLATLLRLEREIVDTHVAAREVHFAHPKPDDVSELVTFFGTERICFDSGENRLVFDPGALGLQGVTRGDALLPVLEEHAATLLSDITPDRCSPLASLQAEIRSRLQRGEMPSFETIAHQLGISRRTLQRRLHDADTNFLLELDRARNELAGIYLDDPNRTLSEIATLLGYADQSAFQRAFRRWRCTTPRRYRIARGPSST